MKKSITVGLLIGCMLILQACTTPMETKEAKVIEPLPVDPAQAAAFLAQNPAETWLSLINLSEGVDSLEINSDRVTRSDAGLNTVWLRLGLFEPVVVGEDSRQVIAQTLMQMQVRCSDNQYRYLSFYAIDKNQNIIDVQEMPQTMFAPLGSTAATAGIYRIACEASPAL